MIVPEHNLIVIPREDDATFGVLQSRIHTQWAHNAGGRLGFGNHPRYNSTRYFDPFPFPQLLISAVTVGASHSTLASPLRLPHNFPQLPKSRQTIVRAITEAAYELNRLRETWLNPPEWVDVAPEIGPGYPDRIAPKLEYAKAIKERTLTNLYNQHPAWLAHAHETLDAAVARAYGWDDYTPLMPDEEILARLLKLNRERSGSA